LDGDASGGGHRSGAGAGNKSEFPQSWSDDDIIRTIEEVANDPASAEEPVYGGRVRRSGFRNRVLITVVVDPSTGEIVTGYPKWSRRP
jgi:hypothetical protein